MMDKDLHTHIAWIPSKFAHIGQKVHFDKFMPESTWTIMETYNSKDYSSLNEHSQDYKTAFPSIENK